MTHAIQDVTVDWTDLTEQMHAATGRLFRMVCQDGLVRLERQRSGSWQAITEWIMADMMALYCDAYVTGISEGYVAAKSGH